MQYANGVVTNSKVFSLPLLRTLATTRYAGYVHSARQFALSHPRPTAILSITHKCIILIILIYYEMRVEHSALCVHLYNQVNVFEYLNLSYCFESFYSPFGHCFL